MISVLKNRLANVGLCFFFFKRIGKYESFYYFLDDVENRSVRRGTQRKITTLRVLCG